MNNTNPGPSSSSIAFELNELTNALTYDFPIYYDLLLGVYNAKQNTTIANASPNQLFCNMVETFDTNPYLYYNKDLGIFFDSKKTDPSGQVLIQNFSSESQGSVKTLSGGIIIKPNSTIKGISLIPNQIDPQCLTFFTTGAGLDFFDS